MLFKILVWVNGLQHCESMFSINGVQWSQENCVTVGLERKMYWKQPERRESPRNRFQNSKWLNYKCKSLLRIEPQSKTFDFYFKCWLLLIFITVLRSVFL